MFHLAILFAQQQPNELAALLSPSYLAAMTGGGFAVWYGWYTTSVSIPRIVKDFREEMKLEREFHQLQLNAVGERCDRNWDQRSGAHAWPQSGHQNGQKLPLTQP